MDFFKKMFEKKECSICGKESGILGNRKLEDGNLCKECTSKLSPWFEERRHATVKEIEHHLGYREFNKEKLKHVKITRSFGEYHKIHIGYTEGYPFFFIVSKENDYVAENADIFFFLYLKDCRLDINEYCTELTRLNENKQRVSYNPPRYEYRYDFYVVLGVQSDFCDEIKFKLNKNSVKVEVERRNNWSEDPTRDVNYQYFANMYREMEMVLVDGMKHGVELQEKSMEQFQKLRKEVEEKREEQTRLLEEARQRQEQEKQKLANKPKFCPGCGTEVGAGKFCRECGYQLVK